MSDKGNIVVDDDKKAGWAQDPIPVDTSKTPAPAKADAVEIEIIDDTPEKDRGKPPRDPNVPPPNVSDEEIKKYSESSQKRIKQLRYEYHEERRQREASQRQAEEAIRVAQHWQQENQRLQYENSRRTVEMQEQARARSENEIKLAQQALSGAIEGGKSDDIAAAQMALSRAVAQREMMPQRPATQQAPQQQQQFNDPRMYQQAPQQQAPSRAEATAPDPKGVKWLKDNQWFGSDKRMTGYAYGVHEELVTERGIDPRSDEYYEEVNAAMRKAFPEEFEDGEPVKASAARPNIVSPPARGAAPRKVQLTASQAAVAKRLGLTLEQYATQLIKEQKANG